MLQHGTCLILAAQRGHLEVVKALVVHGADVDFSDTLVLFSICCFCRWLIWCVWLCCWTSSKQHCSHASLIPEPGHSLKPGSCKVVTLFSCNIGWLQHCQCILDAVIIVLTEACHGVCTFKILQDKQSVWSAAGKGPSSLCCCTRPGAGGAISSSSWC